jgi:hypothetical protein
MVRNPSPSREIREAVCPDDGRRVRVERERDPVVIGNVVLSVDVDVMESVVPFDRTYLNCFDSTLRTSCS